LQKEAVPIGVLLVIFESRPDVLPQITALAVRSGNGLLLKGGKEARFSNEVLHRVVVEGIVEGSNGKVPTDIIKYISDRESIQTLLKLSNDIDLIIPRGNSALVRSIQENTTIPVLGHGEGICHIYIDSAASSTKATNIVIDSKTDYPSACNSLDTLLIHSKWPQSHVHALLSELTRSGVNLHAGPNALKLYALPPAPSFRKEYGSLDLTVEIVENLEEAILHINKYGSGHTDSIITEDKTVAQIFLDRVQSACVFHNCSTRFSDGYRFGLGAEVGISTGRIHARGPVGVEGLQTTKWKLVSFSSAGHIVNDFTTSKQHYLHRPLPISPSKL